MSFSKTFNLSKEYDIGSWNVRSLLFSFSDNNDLKRHTLTISNEFKQISKTWYRV